MAQMWLGRGSDMARTRLGRGSDMARHGSDVARTWLGTRLGRGSEAARSGSGTARAWFGRDLEIIWTIFCPKLKKIKTESFLVADRELR